MSRIEKRAMNKMLNSYLKKETDFNKVFRLFCSLTNKTKGSIDNQ